MVDLSQDPAEHSPWEGFLAHAEGLGQGLLDLAAFGLVAAALWLAQPGTPPQVQVLPMTVASCEVDCIAASALGGPGS